MLGSFLNTITGSLLIIAVTMMATMGIALIFKTSTTTNFAQGSIAALGAYVTTFLLAGTNLPLWVALILAVLIGTALGVLVDVGIFRRGRNVNIVGKQIITMGLVSIIIAGIPMVFGADIPPNLPPFIPGNFSFDVFGTEVTITYHAMVSIVITAVVLGLLFFLLYRSKWGLGVRVTASRESTAELVGVNTFVITATSWGIAAGLAVIAAVMLGGTGIMMNPAFMTRIQVNSFLAGILGGFSTFYGPVVGAVLIPLSVAVVGFFGRFSPFFQDWADVIVYVIMLIIILIKPQGLFGKKIVKKV